MPGLLLLQDVMACSQALTVLSVPCSHWCLLFASAAEQAEAMQAVVPTHDDSESEAERDESSITSGGGGGGGGGGRALPCTPGLKRCLQDRQLCDHA